MSEETTTKEFVPVNNEIMKAWKRLRSDYPKYFLKHPFELELIEKNYINWLNAFEEQINNNTYNPKEMFVCDVPKGKGLIRPGSSLKLSDYFYYNYLVGLCYEQINKKLKWSQGKTDFGYVLSGEIENYKWIKHWLECSEAYRNTGLDYLQNQGYTHVVVTDITGFYENIQHQVLNSDLADLGIDRSLINKLILCLKKWSIVNGKGIPQSCTPSHLLAKVYLNTVDQDMINHGFVHQRYVDDVRIFCRSEIEAKKAILHLTKALRLRGLNVQSSKTRILTAEEATKEIDGLQTIIEEIASTIPNYEEFRQELSRIVSAVKVSGEDDFDEVEFLDEETEPETVEKVKLTPDSASFDVIKKAFSEFFINSEKKFDKTLFRFLLRRLGDAKDDIALEYCKSIIESHPEETETLLKYFGLVDKIDEVKSQLFDFLASPNAIYSYQNHQIITWLIDNVEDVSNLQLFVIRQLAKDKNNPDFLISSARKLLGKFGNNADLDYLIQEYRTAKTEMEQTELLFCVERVEESKRNGFYSQTEKDNSLNKTVIDLIKSRAKKNKPLSKKY